MLNTRLITALICIVLFMIIGCWELPPSQSQAGEDEGDGGDDVSFGQVGDTCGGALPKCNSGLHCQNSVCCDEAATCCTDESHCSETNAACFIEEAECYGICNENGENDALCAEGFHCEDAWGCTQDVSGGGSCNEGSDCISEECINAHCCQHAGLCCETDDECSDMFYVCDIVEPSFSMTCAFEVFDLPDTGLGDGLLDCYNVGHKRVSCSGLVSPNEYSGQDGHNNDNPRQYTDNGTEITDNVTTLIWQKTPNAEQLDLSSAQNYCASLGGSWRIPLRYELQTIVDYGVSSSDSWFIDPIFESPSSGNGNFWTKTDIPGAAGATVWVVDFKTGNTLQNNPLQATAHVRCVY